MQKNEAGDGDVGNRALAQADFDCSCGGVQEETELDRLAHFLHESEVGSNGMLTTDSVEKFGGEGNFSGVLLLGLQ